MQKTTIMRCVAWTRCYLERALSPYKIIDENSALFDMLELLILRYHWSGGPKKKESIEINFAEYSYKFKGARRMAKRSLITKRRMQV